MLATKVRIGSCLTFWRLGVRIPDFQQIKYHMSGYKEMLRNNIPFALHITLLWCNCKTKFINHVYDNFIHVFADHQERHRVTKYIIHELDRDEDINKCINWDDLNNSETEAWNNVRNWHKWFNWALNQETKEYLINGLKTGQIDINLTSEWKDKLIKFLDKNI